MIMAFGFTMPSFKLVDTFSDHCQYHSNTQNEIFLFVKRCLLAEVACLFGKNSD